MNPFTEDFPKFVVDGRPVRSGILKRNGNAAHPEIKAQKYFKFNVAVLGTDVTLDPHIDGHDD